MRYDECTTSGFSSMNHQYELVVIMNVPRLLEYQGKCHISTSDILKSENNLLSRTSSCSISGYNQYVFCLHVSIIIATQQKKAPSKQAKTCKEIEITPTIIFQTLFLRFKPSVFKYISVILKARLEPLRISGMLICPSWR